MNEKVKGNNEKFDFRLLVLQVTIAIHNSKQSALTAAIGCYSVPSNFK